MGRMGIVWEGCLSLRGGSLKLPCTTQESGGSGETLGGSQTE